MDKRRLVKPFQKRVLNPVVGAVAGRGLVGGWAVLETTGRKSGEPRRTPVGYRLDGDTLWIVAEYGRRAAYVKNLEANPRVRVRVRGRWREGVAHPVPEDDARARARGLNGAMVRLAGDDLLTIRVDLDP